MNKLIKYSSNIRKAVAWCNGLTNYYVNLIFSETADLTDDNRRTSKSSDFDFIPKNLYKSIVLKLVSSVLYNKFSKVSITY